MSDRSGAAIPTSDHEAAAALLLLGRGATVEELATRLHGIDVTAAVTRLAELGLVRVASGSGAAARYVPSTLGERQIAASLPEQPRVMATLAELERLRGDLFSAIAHELRTPLTAVRTSVGLLQDPNLPAAAEVREQLTDSIARGAERMQHFIDDMLEIARFRSGTARLQLRRFDAGTLAQEAAAAIQPLLAARGQRLDLRLPSEPLAVYGDHRRLEQALLNLLSNAQKFSPDGAVLGLEVGERGDEVAWSVRDSGPGIADWERERLFERFFTSGDQRAGTGLGLPLALATAQAHGGAIDVESTLGQGSTFTLRVPATGPAEAAEP